MGEPDCGCGGPRRPGHDVDHGRRSRGKLCRIWRILKGDRGRGSSPCVYVPERISNRPDPCIYSQTELMQLGQPVTWDNPDVAIFRGGVEQYTYGLAPATDYDVVVTVHNASRSKPALGTEIAVEWVEFGAGGQIRHPIGTAFVDVPMWPGTTTATFSWRTPANPGHYCIEVDLAHPDDGNPVNNRGWNNTQVLEAHSQVRSPVRVFNRHPDGCPEPPEQAPPPRFEGPRMLATGLVGLTAGFGGAVFDHEARTMAGEATRGVEGALAIMAGGALLGALVGLVGGLRRGRRNRAEAQMMAIAHPVDERRQVPCDLVEVTVDSYRFVDGKGKDVDPAVMFAPRPPAWPARVEPAVFRFAPGEHHRDVELIVDAPDGPGPPEVFNVSVRQGGAPHGGVSVVVERGG